MVAPFLDRNEAGRCLTSHLTPYASRADVVVLALPRGGVPVGWEIARELSVPLDVCIVRKLGVPTQPELAFGAIASGDVTVLNSDVIRACRLLPEDIERVKGRERRELSRRERLYHQRPAPLELTGNIVILVDDGIATGATMNAAIAVVRPQHPRAIVVATPVASQAAVEDLSTRVDRVVCLSVPTTFRAIGEWYENFDQLSDDEVRHCLETGCSLPARSRLLNRSL